MFAARSKACSLGCHRNRFMRQLAQASYVPELAKRQLLSNHVGVGCLGNPSREQGDPVDAEWPWWLLNCRRWWSLLPWLVPTLLWLILFLSGKFVLPLVPEMSPRNSR